MSQRWTDLQRHVIEEHFEDYVEGRISRREMLKREWFRRYLGSP